MALDNIGEKIKIFRNKKYPLKKCGVRFIMMDFFPWFTKKALTSHRYDGEYYPG